MLEPVSLPDVSDPKSNAHRTISIDFLRRNHRKHVDLRLPQTQPSTRRSRRNFVTKSELRVLPFTLGERPISSTPIMKEFNVFIKVCRFHLEFPERFLTEVAIPKGTTGYLHRRMQPVGHDTRLHPLDAETSSQFI